MDRPAAVLYKSNMSRGTAIPSYNLFGEAGDLPDVAHCETIEARSRLHDWELAPHRHARLHQVLFLEDGGGRATLDGQDRALAPMTLVNVPLGHVHGFKFIPGTAGLVVTLAAETLDIVLQSAEGLHHVLGAPAVFPAESACVATLEEMARTFASRGFARAQILRSLAGLLLGQIAHRLVETERVTVATATRGLLARFETLLEQHYLDHWTVADYAGALAVSPTHLSRVTRAARGRPVTRVIRERLVLEARRHLAYTHLSVATIAYALGYRDPAYFSRVFSHATGLAPSEFRSSVSQGVAPGDEHNTPPPP